MQRVLASDEFRSLIRQEVDRSRNADLRSTGYLPSAGGADKVITRLDESPPIGPDGLPVPPKHLWAGYGETVEQYIGLGLSNAGPMERITGEAGVRWGNGIRVLDFGCAAGTMIRTLARHAGVDEIWGCDITAEAIDWARRHLSPPFRFTTNTTAPHLPFEDNYFDLVYCGSVFTHIPDIADAWLMEVARILRPGALLYATIHDQNFIRAAVEQAPEFFVTQLWQTRLSPEEREAKFAQVTLGFGPWSQVFFDTNYFATRMCPRFEHVGTHPFAYGIQTAVVLRKRGACLINRRADPRNGEHVCVQPGSI